MVKYGQGKEGNATPINHHQCVGAREVFWPPDRTKLLRLYHLSHSFSVTTECAVAESLSGAKSTTPPDNPYYILLPEPGLKWHLQLWTRRRRRLFLDAIEFAIEGQEPSTGR